MSPSPHIRKSNDQASLHDTALRSDLAYTYSWGNKLAADLPGNGTTREEWKVGTPRMSAPNRHRRGSRPLGKHSPTPFRLFRHSRVFTGWPRFISQASKRRSERLRRIVYMIWDVQKDTILFYKPFMLCMQDDNCLPFELANVTLNLCIKHHGKVRLTSIIFVSVVYLL